MPRSRAPSAAPRLVAAGDSAWTVTFGDAIDPAINDRVLAFAERVNAVCRAARGVRAVRWPGLVEAVPAVRSATVYFDPCRVDGTALAKRLLELARRPRSRTARRRGRLVEIPVWYGGEAGPDLPSVAEFAGLTEEAVVRLHAAEPYRVYMLGFAPGFPYLGPVPPAIAMPRLAPPRRVVPAGSVGIAGSQTGIYPQDSPGGWRIIGRTPRRLYDPSARRPFVLAPGDRVRFVPIARETFERLRARRG